MTNIHTTIEKIRDNLQTELQTFEALFKKSMDSDISYLMEMLTFAFKGQGKQLRPLLTLAAAKACLHNQNEEIHADVFNLASAVEMIHSATLLHDDVIDMSDLRRGKPTCHTVFGNTATILLGDYLFSKAFQLMVRCETSGVLDILSNVSSLITEGEMLQLKQNFDLSVSIDQYRETTQRKTAALFRASTWVGAYCQTNHENPDLVSNLKNFGEHFGMAFQMRDDLLDYFPTQDFGKDCGDDFFEGKMTLPLIVLYQKIKENSTQDFFIPLWEDLKNTASFDRKEKFAKELPLIQKWMHQFNVFEECQYHLKGELDKAFKELDYLPDSEMKILLISLTRGLGV